MSTPDTPTRNRDLFYAIAELVEQDPERHDQNVWERPVPEACGTIACVAGWACILGRPDDFQLTERGFYEPKLSTIEEALRHHFEYGPEETVEVDDLVGQLGYRAVAIQTEDPIFRGVARTDLLARVDYWQENASGLLGVDEDEADTLFAPDVGPLGGLTVAEALRAIGDGAPISEVWGYDDDAEDIEEDED
jgi:hypothetical protein